MPIHEVMSYSDLSEKIRERVNQLSELISLVRQKVGEQGLTDIVIKVEVMGEDVKTEAYDRTSYQGNLLSREPRDSAEDVSFFVTLNDPVVGGFWVILQLDTEPHDYLFQMVYDDNMN